MFIHGMACGIMTGNRSVGSLYRKVEIAAERPLRLDVAPGDTLTVPWLGTLVTLLAIVRRAPERGVMLCINDKPPRDVAECGPFQWSATGHFEPGAIELASLTVRNDSAETVNVELLLGFAAEPTAVGAEAPADGTQGTNGTNGTKEDAIADETAVEKPRRKKAA